MTNKTHTISELARAFDITTRTIRFYEEKGLLNPQRVGQQRLYTDADRVRLTLIQRGKRIGMSLQEAQAIIEMYNPAHGNVEQLKRLLDNVNVRKQQLEAQMRDLKQMLTELDDVEKRCQQALHKVNRKENH
jgi:DNA-binding transcriptional MerR regulator